MDYRFTALTIGVLLAALAGSRVGGQRTAPAVEGPGSRDAVPTAAVADRSARSMTLIQQAIRRLKEQESISANVRHRTELFGQKLVGSGRYYQTKSPKGLMFRLSLAVRSGDRTLSLLHICNGRTLWVRDTVDSTLQFSRIDLNRLREPQDDPAAGAAAGSAWLPGGGLPQLLTSLQANFDFDPPKGMEFQDVPVWALAGRWNPARLAKRLPAQLEILDDQGRLRMEHLPAQVPDRVLLLLGRDDLFPYHIDFRRTMAGDDSAADTDDGYQTSRSLVTMELFEVQFGAALDPLLFVCNVADADAPDGTDRYLSKLRKN